MGPPINWERPVNNIRYPKTLFSKVAFSISAQPLRVVRFAVVSAHLRCFEEPLGRASSEYNDFMNDRYRKWGHYYGFKYGGIGISNYSSWLHVDQYREVVKEYSVNKDMNKVKPISNKTETITSKMKQ